MNKKNKGFTLIEVLATIAIIAVVTLIATITYTRVRHNIVNRQYNNLKLLIESAGVKYASKTGVNNFYVEVLIKEGYLEPDDDDNKIYDPRDEHPLNCHLVHVSVEGTNYTATLDGKSHELQDGCDETRIVGEDVLYLTAILHGTDVNYQTSSSSGAKLTNISDNIYKNVKIVNNQGAKWTNYQLDLTAGFPKTMPYYFDIIGAKYIWNKNPDVYTIESNRSHTTNVKDYYNDYYYVDLYSKDERHLQAKVMYKYDKEKPSIDIDRFTYANKLDEKVWKKRKTFLIYATDNGVGLDRVYAGQRPCSDLLKDPNMGTAAVPNSNVHTHVIDDIETGIEGENGIINVCAVDKLGNLAEDKKSLSIKIDITPPHCTKNLNANRSEDVIGEHNKYQYASRTIRQYCYDNNMINGRLVTGSGCTHGSDYYEKTFSPEVGDAVKIGYIRITDNVGWYTDCPVDAYVDRKAPVCQRATGNTQSHKNNNDATTLGVGTTDNWDQNFRHITQYCYDEHVGCKQDSYSKNWSYNDELIIRTDTITIYDKVPYCSRQETVTSSNCSGSDWNSDYNKTHYNNARTCTEGVYIDHVPPVAYQTAGQFHQDNKIKVGCNDEGSGVNFFSASEVIWHNNSNYGANDGYTENGDTQQNTDGGLLSFMMTSAKLQPRDWADINIHTTCRDKAGNEETDKNIYFNGGIPPLTTIYGTYNQLGVVTEWTGALCGDCKLRKYRDTSAENCAKYSYECSCYDTPCGSTNSGMGRTCCLSGSDPYYGCKTHATTLTKFGEQKTSQPYNGNVSAKYVQLNSGSNVYYVLPDRTKEDEFADFVEWCTAGDTCAAGYECLHFKCYVDTPTDSFPKLWVCGNYY